MVKLLPSLVKLQCLKDDIHPNFIPELETVCECLFRAVYFYGNTINLMFLNTSLISLICEPVNKKRRIFE